HNQDGDQRNRDQDRQGAAAEAPAALAAARQAGANRRLHFRRALLRKRLSLEPELVGEALPVEPEEGGVGANEAARVGATGEHVPLLVLERTQVADTDLRARSASARSILRRIRASRSVGPISVIGPFSPSARRGA